MIYIFGLVDALAKDIAPSLDKMPGLQGEPRCSPIGPWVLVWEPHDGDEIMPRRRNMLAHTRVVEKMMDYGTVLPARFGLLADDFVAIEQLVQIRAPQISEKFALLHDCVEVGVRIRFQRPPALALTLQEIPELMAQRDKLAQMGPEGHFDRAEFGRKLADALDRRRGLAQKEALKKLVPHANDHVLRSPEEDTEILRAEFLIPRNNLDGFVAHVAEAAETSSFLPGSEPEIEIIGPAPMYNFVRLSLSTEPEEEAA